MIPSDVAQSKGDIMREIAEIRREIREMRAERGLESATIGQGGITILEGAVRVVQSPSTERLVMGKLSDGDYGIEAVGVDGLRVKLASLSSYTKAQTINVQESTTSAAWVNLTTPGPAVTVTVGPSGRALMFLSAKGGWSLVAADIYQGAFMSAELSGANVAAPDLQWSAFCETQHGSTTFATVSTTIGAVYTFEGLAEGPTTFTAKYSVGNAGRSADFNRRTIVVIAL